MWERRGAVLVEQVKCPSCGRRLFDKEVGSTGGIAIKCPICRNVCRVKLGKEKERRMVRNSVISNTL